MLKSKRNIIRTLMCGCLAFIWILAMQSVAIAAYNTVPQKPYPTLDEAKIVSGQSPDVEIHLKFSNNVGCIDENQADRYKMTGYNEANLTKFHLETADGTPVDIRVTPYPKAEMHTDESKFFYIFADGLDTSLDYVLTVDEDLYANMGNSLGSSYEVTFNISTGNIDFEPTSTLPDNDIVQALTLDDSSIPNNSTNVSLNPEITLHFSANVSGIDVFEYNCAFLSLMKGTEKTPIEITGGTDFKDIVIKPKAALLANTEYKVVINKYFMARNGSTLSSSLNLYFTTKAADAGGGAGGGGAGGGGAGGETETETDTDTDTNTETETGSETAKDIYFSDVKNSWAANDINHLADRGIVMGTPEGTFLPNKGITRAEVVAILVRAFELNSDKNVTFNDTANHWAKGYIAIAAACGIVNGIDEGIFSPSEMVTREQLASMIVRAGKLTTAAGKPLIFKDTAKTSSWAVTNIEIASANGIINGYEDGSFRPKNNVTRAEACRMIINLLSKQQ